MTVPTFLIAAVAAATCVRISGQGAPSSTILWSTLNCPSILFNLRRTSFFCRSRSILYPPTVYHHTNHIPFICQGGYLRVMINNGGIEFLLLFKNRSQ